MATNDRLHRYLERLPEPPLPQALLGRIEGERRRGLQRRRWGAAVAASAVLAVALLPALRDGTLPTRSPVAPQPAQVAAAPSAQVDAERMAQLRALDRDLQNAYDRGATHEAEALWAARQALLAGHRGERAHSSAIRI
jgi:hypothetical protein